MDAHLESKLRELERVITTFPSALIAFSGGTDSTLLAFVSNRVLVGKILLVTATSSTYPKKELEDAIALAKEMNAPHILIESDELDIPEFITNPANRCYHCKKELFTKLKHLALDRNLAVIFDGANVSDDTDFRPGRIAAQELSIISPLAVAGLSKNDIRALSRHFHLATADKPAQACLSSRFPYGETITREKLGRVEKAEIFLRDLGFLELRVRNHGNLARIEVNQAEISQVIEKKHEIISFFKELGYVYVCVDLRGYRTGSMNESLTEEDKLHR